MRRVSVVLALLLIVFAALAGWVTAVQAQSAAAGGRPEKRVALVIGNNDYQNFVKLDNPANDADSLAEVLKSINFDVVLYKNTTLHSFYRALSEFNKKAKDADVALIYFAGHGVQFNSKNYLLQVDDEAETLDDISIGSVPVERVLEILNAMAGVKVLILDACRNNPAKHDPTASRSIDDSLSRDVGLARLEDYDTSGGRGMVIAYATSPNHVAADGSGKNSPYNDALVKWISAPDMTIQDILSNVRDEVVAATKKKQFPIFDSSLWPYKLNSSGSEWVEWNKVKKSDDISEWRRFLDQHPDSAHAPDAKHKVEIMQANLAEAAWTRIKDSSDPAELKKFKETFPDSPHAAEADKTIAALEQKRGDQSLEKEWDRLKVGSDIGGLQDFRRRYPNSSHSAEADKLISDLQRKSEEQTREAVWDQLKATSDRGKLQAFRARYPDSPEAAEADELIADLQRKSDDQTRKTTWGQIKTSSDRVKLQAFRDRYPDSPEAAEADKLIADLQSKEFDQARKAAWGRIKVSSDLAQLEQFSDRYAGSPEAAEADNRIRALQQEAAWNRVKDSFDPERLRDFRDGHPNSPHDAEAVQLIAKGERKIEDQRWDQVNNKSDIPGLQRFRDTYPSSPHAAEAEKQIANLQQEAAWIGVRNKGDLGALAAFVTFYPNSPHAAEAENLIVALRRTIDQRQGAVGAAQQPPDAAEKAEEACDKDSAEVAKIAKLGSANALKAMRQRSGMLCPMAIAAIDAAIRDITCKDEGDRVRARGDDLASLGAMVGSLTCGDSLADAKAKIALLEQDHERAEKERAEKACDDAKNEVDNRIDLTDAGAGDALAKFETRTDCPSVQDDATGKIKEIEERVSSAQILLTKFGCYTAQPSSGRFDKPTRDAIGRFERGAHLTLDEAHLTADLAEKMRGNADAGGCQPTAPPPAPAPPSVAAIPPKIAPVPVTIPVRHEPIQPKATPQPKPPAGPRFAAHKVPAEPAAPAASRHPAPASARPVASAPAAPPAPFIPN